MRPEDRAERERIIGNILDQAARRKAVVTARLLELALAEMYPTAEETDRG